MGEQTAISWTDHTFNPWWGCTRVSPGCQHCYAEAFAKRTGHDVWGKGGDRRFFASKHWDEPLKWNDAAAKTGRPALVFCASMADVFERYGQREGFPASTYHDPLDEHRRRLFHLVEDTPHLIWQLLTKRPENVTRMVPDAWFTGGAMPNGDPAPGWPRNAWIGATVEDQQRADERVPQLLQIPAPVRFLSCEPLLGHVDLEYSLPGVPGRIGWVIIGGESGPGHRPLDLDHARHLRDQANAAGIPWLFKQVGGQRPTSGGDLLDGVRHKAFPPSAKRSVVHELVDPWDAGLAAARRSI